MSKEDLKTQLQALLQDVLKARFRGGKYADLARAHGYADGYMRALIDAELIEEREMLTLVGDERQRFIESAPNTDKMPQHPHQSQDQGQRQGQRAVA